MSEHEKNTEMRLDEAVEALRRDELAPAEVERIARSARGRLSAESSASGVLRTCSDFQALIPDLAGGRLSEARALLVEAHTRECIPCRRALNAARFNSAPAVATPVRVHRTWLRWGAVAAGVLLTVAVVQFLSWKGLMPGFSGKAAALDSVRGPVFVLAGNDLKAVEAGAEIRNRQVVRTGKGGGAVLRLDDGSAVELAERTEATVVEGWLGATVELTRGNLIVEAAEQGSGRLAVRTSDMQVAVKGTVFSVSHGMKGSRVSVLEGEVWVSRAGERTALTPGGQYSSNPGLARVSIQEDYAWSQEAARHLAVLNELSGLTRELQQATFGDHLRFNADLAADLPARTVVYAALPNLSGQLEPALQAFRARVESSPTLSSWFAEHGESGEGLATLDELVAKLSAAGRNLGDEVVLAVAAPAGDPPRFAPVVLAEVTDAAGLRALVAAEVARLNSLSESDRPAIQLLDDPSQAVGGEHQLYIWIGPDRLVLTASAELLQEVSGMVPGDSLVDAPFFQTIAGRYQDGVDWLLAMDLERLSADQAKAEEPRELLDILGIETLQSLVVEREQVQGVTENRAVLSYTGHGTGLMRWLGQPGPMGGLDFVSRDANLAAAFVISDPSGLVDQLLQRMAQRDPNTVEAIRNFELEHGFEIRRDIIGPLGGEVVVAMDGPMLPTPAWKVVVEVYDPATLQRTMEWAVNELNQLASAEGKPGVTLTALNTAGNATWELHSDQAGVSIYYRFVGGYVVAAPDPALIDRAIQVRQSGYSLSASPGFVALLPQDSQANLSGLFYQNLAPLLEPLLSSGLGQSLGGESLQNLEGTPPMLAAMYAEPGRITVSGVGDLESLLVNLAAFRTLGAREAAGRVEGTAVR